MQFGGILEVTKESDEIYIFHLPSSTWKLIDVTFGPCNVNELFKVHKDSNKI